jgi:hypothetical protein
MIITATQIKINNIFGLLCFITSVQKIRGQLSKAEGLVFVKYNGLSTLSGWENHAAMKAFRNNGHHLDAMKNIKNIGKAKSITWEAQSEPDWHKAKERLHSVQF